MLRFIIKRRELDRTSELQSERLYTIDCDARPLESALRSGGRGQSAYEIHELIGVEVLPDPQ